MQENQHADVQVYAISSKAKDVREVVQGLNLRRQAQANADLEALDRWPGPVADGPPPHPLSEALVDPLVAHGRAAGVGNPGQNQAAEGGSAGYGGGPAAETRPAVAWGNYLEVRPYQPILTCYCFAQRLHDLDGERGGTQRVVVEAYSQVAEGGRINTATQLFCRGSECIFGSIPLTSTRT